MDADLSLKLERDSRNPLYLQIRDQVRDLILAGRLVDGWRLPPERQLAVNLGVNRSTVVNAYRELQSEGLIEGHVGRGTVVRRPQMPTDESLASSSYVQGWNRLVHDPVLAEVNRLSNRPGAISFVGAGPDPGLYPLEVYRQINDFLLESQGQAVLQHCPVEGHYPLREAIAALMARGGASVAPYDTLVIGGSQEGLYLIAQAFLEPNDAVAVENPTYLGAIQVFRAIGARLIGIPMDDDGLRIEILEAVLCQSRPKLIYTLPTYHNPTGRSLSLHRRHRLLQLARSHHVPIVEDDPIGWLRYSGPVLPSLKALDRSEQVIHLSTFSEMLFPGLRLGWLSAPGPILRAVGGVKRLADPTSNSLAQWATAEFCRRGFLVTHLQTIRDAYARRLDRTLSALRRHAPDEITWSEPRGGLFVWCTLAPWLRARDLLIDAPARQVTFLPGEVFHLDGSGQSYLRLNFTSCPEESIDEGIRRLCAAVADRARDHSRCEEGVTALERPIV